MKALQFILDNWDSILIVLIAVISGIVGLVNWIKHIWVTLKEMTPEEKIAYSKRLLENLMPIALSLVTNAEVIYGGGTGALKRAVVMDELYARIPDEFKKYIDESNLDNIIETALIEAKALWETNKDVQALIQQPAATEQSNE